MQKRIHLKYKNMHMRSIFVIVDLNYSKPAECHVLKTKYDKYLPKDNIPGGTRFPSCCLSLTYQHKLCQEPVEGEKSA